MASQREGRPPGETILTGTRNRRTSLGALPRNGRSRKRRWPGVTLKNGKLRRDPLWKLVPTMRRAINPRRRRGQALVRDGAPGAREDSEAQPRLRPKAGNLLRGKGYCPSTAERPKTTLTLCCLTF